MGVEAGVLAVGLGGRNESYRVFAEATGAPLVGAFGLGCWVILFVGLPLVACGYGLVTAARSDSTRAWCRHSRRPP